MSHPVFQPGNVAVITGGASGIGLAAAIRFARLGLKICIADLGQQRLDEALAAISAAAPDSAGEIMTSECDVSRADELRRLETAVRERFGGTDVLMNNAGIQPGSSMFGPEDNWQRILGVNLWGVINGTHAFVPGMLERGRPGLVINTARSRASPRRPAIPPIMSPRRG